MLQYFDRKICIFVTGLGVSLDSDKPHLVGIDEDVSSTGITLYHLLDGATNIGSEEKTNDIGSDFVRQISSLLSQIFSHVQVTQKMTTAKVEQFTKLQILTIRFPKTRILLNFCFSLQVIYSLLSFWL